MKLTVLLSICVAIGLLACERNNSLSGYRFDRGTFPETVTNLGDVNSAEDDYNSTVPAFGDVMSLVFSSKRGGRSDFNFVRESINYSFDRSSGKFSVDNKPYGGLDILQEQAPIGLAVNAANSSANELGPYMLSYDRDLIKDGYNRHYAEYFMLFASDRTGNLDIYLTHNFQQNPTGTSAVSGSSSTNKPFVEPIRVPFLNSSADDAYPTFDKDFRTIYFTSNRAGSFDIYKASFPALKPTELHTGLPVLTNVSIERVTGLSSGADDKCPFILNDMLVFTSNRAGGFGGYDLYYSKWNGDGWSEPVNFGPSINTASDEYRPVLTSTDSYTNQLMIFSSNRPGGKGGFDLYMVGVAK